MVAVSTYVLFKSTPRGEIGAVLPRESESIREEEPAEEKKWTRCLPDEDLPPGPQRDGFKELHAARAQKYSAYLTQLSRCYGRL
ncbi:hypothetical protein TELCIR_19908 [Teladorsagia circumcincta]|uniref:Uncharacterized protein n=1 Tax=Teladorsagia circumcincta TaxID=45464 RepID=A0A2G9TME7_TELCI|nr:hypothetical protein TELCIR_19908 [Teladorsagia circumcincta]